METDLALKGVHVLRGGENIPALQIEENSFLSAMHQDFFDPKLSNGKSGEEWAAQTIQGGPERDTQQASLLIGSIRAAAARAPAAQEAVRFMVIGFRTTVHNPVINSTNYLGDSLDWGKQDHAMKIP